MPPLHLAMLSTHTCPLAALGGWETGGMNVYVRELGRALGARDVEVDIYTRRQSRDVPDIVAYAPGVRVIHIDAGPQRHVDKYDVLDYLPEFACGVQRFRALTGTTYDLIHGHYWLSGRLGSLFSEHWGVPLVSTFHTLAQVKNRVAETAAESEQTVRYEIERRTMAHSDRIIALSPTDQRQLVQHYGRLAPITLIPGGVNLDEFRPRGREAARHELGLPVDGRILLFVGRIQRLKGLDVLLEAVARLRDPSTHLLIVGGQAATDQEGREMQRLAAIIGKLGLGDQTRLVGAVPHAELPLYYSAADATVMPSSYESFGLVGVESLACGTPVVATRVGGLTAVVRDGENGFLVPWRDPGLFAARLKRVLEEPALRAHMASKARESVRDYGWDRVASDHLAVYTELRERSIASVG